MLAVIVVRDGVLPAGAHETISECGGNAAFVGSGTRAAAGTTEHVARRIVTIEVGDFRPSAWSVALAATLAGESIIVLPASPDGRDLAPRLATELGRPLFAMALAVSPSRVDLVRRGGAELHTIEPPAAFVATLQPGVRGVDRVDEPAPIIEERDVAITDGDDATFQQLLPPDPRTIDLSEADRIVAGGAGLDAASRFRQVEAVATALRASVGATRVVTDRGWIGHERQIGTTGVAVDPDLYIAMGISGAVQHTSGLGEPRHVISVNVDPYCPMMQLADLAVVADANLVLDALVDEIGAAGG